MSSLVALAILGGIALVAVLYGVGIYNQLIALKNRFENAFSQIEVQLKRRYDLIPNLVETVKGYMGHERGTLEAVIQARNQAVGGLQRAAANPGDPPGHAGLGRRGIRADRRAGPDVRLGRGLSRPQGQSEHGPAHRRDHLDREQSGLRPAGVQRRRDRSTTPTARVSHRSSSPTCSATATTRNSWTSTTRKSRKHRRFRLSKDVRLRA